MISKCSKLYKYCLIPQIDFAGILILEGHYEGEKYTFAFISIIIKAVTLEIMYCFIKCNVSEAAASKSVTIPSTFISIDKYIWTASIYWIPLD